jgi:hypothetical protein
VTLAAIAAAGFCLVCSGCAYTASPALLPQHLKTVAIPVFENATPEAQLEQQITTAVVAAFVRDNHLKIVDEKSANAVIRGKVTQYRNAVFGFTNASTATQYRVTVGVQVTFKDLVKNRELWSDEIVKSVIYYVQQVPDHPAQTELDGRQEAVAKLADEILSRSVEGW